MLLIVAGLGHGDTFKTKESTTAMALKGLAFLLRNPESK